MWAHRRVYDVAGHKVAALLEQRPYAPDWHQVSFDGSGLPSGVYLYQLQTGSFTSTRRMQLLK